MSSVEYHEDEWGRHWSQAPTLHGVSRPPFSIGTSLAHMVRGALEIIARKRQESANRYILEQLNPMTLRDIYPDEAVLLLRNSRHADVLDAFGRPLP